MKDMLSNTSIKKQFIFLVLGMGGLIATSIFIYTIVVSVSHEKERFAAETLMEGKLLADFTITPLVFLDQESVNENLNLLSSDEAVKQVVVYNKNHKIFAHYNPHNLSAPRSDDLHNGFGANFIFLNKGGIYTLHIPILFKGETLGYLYLKKDTSEIWNYFLDALMAFILFSALLIIIVIFITIKKSQVILEPIFSLALSLQRIAKKKDYTVRVHYRGNNEIAQLYVATNALLQETQSLTEGLEQRVAARTEELSTSLETLKDAQVQLIESEKMAALGNLVSGVAHEVNTPLGNALTGGSIILRESKLIQDSLSDGSLKRSVMDEKLGIIIQSATLMIKSLTNAAELVKNFKRISVDQSIDDLRDFDLRGYLETIIQTYHNKLKHQHVEVEIISEPSVQIYSYPGSFAQIFNNLINNTLLHAFAGMDVGAKITIELQQREEYLMVRFSDNGSGVDETILPNIFEPFVTSKRNAGGTGLGMNIIYNIVTQKLKGTIHVASQINKGTSFKLRLPYLQKKAIGEVLP
jgi:signal transduction histidine kinase